MSALVQNSMPMSIAIYMLRQVGSSVKLKDFHKLSTRYLKVFKIYPFNYLWVIKCHVGSKFERCVWFTSGFPPPHTFLMVKTQRAENDFLASDWLAG